MAEIKAFHDREGTIPCTIAQGERIVCTGNSPIRSLRADGKLIWQEPEEIPEKGFTAVTINGTKYTLTEVTDG